MESYKVYIKIENYRDYDDSEFFEEISEKKHIEGTNYLNATSKLLPKIKNLQEIQYKKPEVKTSKAYISKIEKESGNNKISKIEGKIASFPQKI